MIVDVRPTNDFAVGHLAGALGIALDGRFAEQAGSVIDADAAIVLVGDSDGVTEARLRLQRIGFDRVVGAVTRIEQLLAEHPGRAAQLTRITAADFLDHRDSAPDAMVVIDVRNPGEVSAAPLEGARNIPLARLGAELDGLQRSAPTVVVCAGGARSAIASSVLRAAGFTEVADVIGGVTALGDRRVLQHGAVIAALLVLGALIGLTLGALGAGGSILAVPVLVHVADLPASAATATSLVAVGSAALVAATGHRHRLRLDVAAWFVPTGLVGAMVGAAIGDRLDETALLLGFSALMLGAAARMLMQRPSARSLSAAAHARTLRSSAAHHGSIRRDLRHVVVVGLAGLGVGALTGLFGVGGGFVIVPALTLAVGLAMPEAIATSLVIITANAAVALVVRGPDSVDWPIAVALTVPMLAGSLVGARLARRIDADRSRQAFAILLVIVAVANALAI